MSNCGGDTEANLLIGTLTADAVFPIPNPDLSGIVFPGDAMDTPVVPLTIGMVTDTTVEGAGAFDVLMRGFRSHLKEEWEANRITGDDYTKAYIALTESAMSQSIQFLLQKDQSFWQAQALQLQAFTAQVQFETSKVVMADAQYSASAQKANYALTKMKVATEEITYCTAKYNLANMLPAQLILLQKQQTMVSEQTDAQRAQTLDTRADGQPVLGVLGKQKELYGQQITSYKRDTELKVAKIFSDSWTVQKTIDEGLVPPTSFTNPEIEKVMVDLRTKADLGV